MDRHLQIQQDLLKSVVDKAVEVQSEIASDRGPFALFALDSIDLLQNRWQLLASADWIDADSAEEKELVRDRLCAKLDLQEKTLIDEFRVLPSADSTMTSIRQKWAHAWRGRGFVFVSDPVPDGMDVTHTTCLIVCRPMP
jgi:hypothetical protein